MAHPPREVGIAEMVAVLILALIFDAISLIPFVGGLFAVFIAQPLLLGALGLIGVKIFAMRTLAVVGFGVVVEFLMSFLPALTAEILLSVALHNAWAKAEQKKQKNPDANL